MSGTGTWRKEAQARGKLVEDGARERASQLGHAPRGGDCVDLIQLPVLECDFQRSKGKSAGVLLAVEPLFFEDMFRDPVLQKRQARIVCSGDEA